MSLEQAMKELAELFPDRGPERWIRAIAEEAGEVTGAFNKWEDENIRKPKTLDDVVEELVQLHAMTLVTASVLGVHPDRMTCEAEAFLNRKAEQIKYTRASLKALRDSVYSIDEVRKLMDLPPWGKIP